VTRLSVDVGHLRFTKQCHEPLSIPLSSSIMDVEHSPSQVFILQRSYAGPGPRRPIPASVTRLGGPVKFTHHLIDATLAGVDNSGCDGAFSMRPRPVRCFGRVAAITVRA
jgi:hypothetical protein